MTRTALVTGASRGLGAEIARVLAPDHHLHLGATSSWSLNETLKRVPDSTPFAVDLTDAAALADAVRPIESLDVLVHNAGVAEIGPVEGTSLDVWRKTFEANMFAVAELTRLLLPALRAARGHVVMINSGAGIRANPGWSAYAASKFALRAFADALRAEETTLRVTSIFPGRIDTDMQRSIVATEGDVYEAGKFLTASTVAAAVRAAIDTPADAHPVEVVLRPTAR